MNTELQHFHAQIIKARIPEDVFGDVTDRQAAQKLYRHFATLAHEDRHQGQPDDLVLAREAFRLLGKFWLEAEEKFGNGTYGKRTAKVLARIASKTNEYEITDGIAAGDLAQIYGGRSTTGVDVIVKIARGRQFNDLMQRESRVLAKMRDALKPKDVYQRFFPKLVESFTVRNTKNEIVAVNVMTATPKTYDLTQVASFYPKGVPPRNFVWIFKRLLSMLSFAHEQGKIIHGAILPTHVLVRPGDHSILLVDWCYATETGVKVPAMIPGYRPFYAPEIPGKRPATPGSDIYMAATCMEYILGGENAENIPKPFIHFLNSCMIANPVRRPYDAWKLYEEFEKLAKDVYGPAKWVDLVMQ